MKTERTLLPVAFLKRFLTLIGLSILTTGPAYSASVTLENPPNGATVTSGQVVFTCSAMDGAGLVSASLYAGPVSAPQTVNLSGPTHTDDTELQADAPDSNHATALSLNVDGATPHAHALIGYPSLIGTGENQVPPGARILSASLHVRCTNPGNTVTLYRLTEAWSEEAATWNQRLPGIPWSVAGADGLVSHAPTGAGAAFPGTGWTTVDVTRFVQEWSDGYPNHGLVLVDGGTDGVDFDSSESASPPVLAVTYQVGSLAFQELRSLSGMTDTVTFSAVPVIDGQQYAWNCLVQNSTGQDSWAALDSFFEVDLHYPDHPTLVQPAHGATQVPTSAILEVSVSDPDPGDSLDVTFYGRSSTPGEEFTIAVLPDSQKYVASASYAGVFTAQTQWIVNNQAVQNIVFVTHEGDVVDTATDAVQYSRADASLSLLDGVVPYGLTPGNHDQPTTLFNQFFPYTRYAGLPWYGGHYPITGNENSYQVFAAGGLDFVILHLQFWPTGEDITWADSVLKAHPRHRAIITTHGFLGLDGSRNVHTIGSTEYIWNSLVVPNDNVYFVLCGHVSGEARRTDVVNGREVHQLLADYQSYPEGGQGWMRLMRFVPVENRVYVRTFSPHLNSDQTDADSQFELYFPMGGFAEIGAQTGLTSGANASVTWTDLAPETDHEWFVSVSDSSGRTTLGPLWQFRTAPPAPDTTPPALSGIQAIEITDASARIVWTTDEPADARVDYGLDAGYGTVVQDPSLATSHSITLTGLTPNTTYHYRVTSADAAQNAASSGDLTLTTLPLNTPPTASDDSYTIDEDNPLNIAAPGVLANDHDPESQALTAVLEAPPGHGSLTLNADGSFTYIPDLNYYGPDNFTYKAHDSVDYSQAAIVSITVNEMNDPPGIPANLTAAAGFAEVTLNWSASSDPEGDAVSYGVYRSTISGSYEAPLATVSDPSYTDTEAVNGTTYYYKLIATDSLGASSLESQEVSATPQLPVVYAYASQNPDVPTGTVTGDYTATLDADGSTQNITEVGNAAGSQLLADYRLDSGVNPSGVTTLSLHLTASWTGLDANDPLSILVWSASSGIWEDVTSDIADGEFVPFAPQNYVAADGAVLVRFQNNISIKKERKDTVAIDQLYARIEMGPPLPPNTPPVASDDAYAVDEDTALTVFASGVLENDTDADADPLTAVPASQPANGNLMLSGNGAFTYTPGANFNGTDSFTYVANDGRANSAPATVTITVTPVNDIPMANDDSWTMEQDSLLTVAAPGVLANDSDPDGDPLSVVAHTDPSNGNLTLNGDGSCTYTPSAGFIGTESFTYTVSDGNGGINTATVTITVQAPGENTIHVADITLALAPAGKNWKAIATVRVVNQTGVPQAGVIVYGDWYFKDALIQSGASGSTDGNGSAVLTSPPARARSGDTFRVVITDLVLSGTTYNSSQNVETEDSIALP